LLLTFFGFAISIWQIRQAKSAADAAALAVLAIQVRVSRYDAAVDLAEAKASLKNAKRYADLEAWVQFVACYEVTSEALGRVALQALIADNHIAENIRKSQTRIAKTCNLIEKYLEGMAPAPVKSALNKSIRFDMNVVQEAEQKNWKGAIS